MNHMLTGLLAILTLKVTNLIETLGYGGVFLFMAIESANIPIPSEVIMPFSGFLASKGVFSFWLVVLVGALGNLIGSQISYAVGYWGGRPFLERWGKYFFVNQNDLNQADEYLQKHGLKIAFFSRLLPVVRTFISLPAGINRARFWPFSFYTFLGSVIWSASLAYIGFVLGENWGVLHPIFQKFSFLIAGFMALAAVLYVLRHLRVVNKSKVL